MASTILILPLDPTPASACGASPAAACYLLQTSLPLQLQGLLCVTVLHSQLVIGQSAPHD